MQEDIAICKELGVQGVVFGILLPDGRIDVERNRTLLQLARPLKATFHRAFDMAADPLQALEGFTPPPPPQKKQNTHTQ